MSKILFTHSYFYQFDPKQWRMAEPYPPLMTITAASLMRESGHEVDLYDVGLLEDISGLPVKLKKFKPDYFVIFDDGFNYLTKMCLTRMREAAFEMQTIARQYGAKVMVCSSDSTDHAQKYLKRGADFVILGEGELTLQELINQLEKGRSGHDVQGISYLESDQIKSTPPRKVNTQLDQLPVAAWDLVDISSYRDIWMSGKNKAHYLNVATTRGCPYKCNWCAKPIYGNRYNVRSPQLVAEEIEHHMNCLGVDHFWMCDDIFGLKPGWVQEFRDTIIQKGLNIRYKIQSRADLLLEEDNIDALVDSGLDEVWIGAESGSQSILDAMDKGTTLEQISQATQLLKQKGVKVAFFIQYGYLGETFTDIKKTIKLITRLMPDLLGISVSYPLPGTKFYDKVKMDLKNKANWVDSDDLDMMFSNTYRPKFYKLLHRYTHLIYGFHKALHATNSVIMLKDKPHLRNIKTVIKGCIQLPYAWYLRVRMGWMVYFN